jgi:hypothetical protein
VPFREAIQQPKISAVECHPSFIPGDEVSVTPVVTAISNILAVGGGASMAAVGDALENAGADFYVVNLYGVISGGITGTPYALPTGWKLVNGQLVQGWILVNGVLVQG